MGLLFESDDTPYVMLGDHKIKLEKMPITEEFYVNKARNELRETEENIENGLIDLRALLKKEANLVVPIDDDEFLLKFLRPCKFYAESAFKKIQAYYQFRLTHKDYCRDLYPSAVRLAFDHSIVSVLSPRDQHGRRIMFVESGERWNPRHVPLREVFRGVQLGLESAMVEPRTQVCGVSVILELKGLSFSQIMQFTPSFAKMVVDWIQDCIPIRLKGVHIVNQPYIFNMLFAIFKPFLREKLRSRIFFHGSDRKSLLQHIDADALMQRIGGSLPDDGISGEVMWQMMHHYEESFRRAASYGYSTNNNNK
ncbi:alpha-tocopherol transfer protein-like [Bicyclus anynana]|uniref:Alpha-tocopherol transfer protein-like n=1 Tax=Bicyclus anynana TaxID=110368 RepID=A0A6J1NQD8_BICAN|nr:alpha-tocopherol transfer protein-like [Bicyclus anynana]